MMLQHNNDATSRQSLILSTTTDHLVLLCLTELVLGRFGAVLFLANPDVDRGHHHPRARDAGIVGLKQA